MSTSRWERRRNYQLWRKAWRSRLFSDRHAAAWTAAAKRSLRHHHVGRVAVVSWNLHWSHRIVHFPQWISMIKTSTENFPTFPIFTGWSVSTPATFRIIIIWPYDEIRRSCVGSLPSLRLRCFCHKIILPHFWGQKQWFVETMLGEAAYNEAAVWKVFPRIYNTLVSATQSWRHLASTYVCFFVNPKANVVVLLTW